MPDARRRASFPRSRAPPMKEVIHIRHFPSFWFLHRNHFMNRLLRKSLSFALIHHPHRELSRTELICSCTDNLGILKSCAKSINFCTKKTEGVEAFNSICDLIRRNADWKQLDATFRHVELKNTLVNGILLDLKELVYAKKALSFFHWCSQQKNYQHSTHSYCLIIHILVRAELLIDARAMLEKVILNNSGSETLLFSIVENLLSTYKDILSCPKVFDYLVQTFSKLRMFDMAIKASTYIGEHGCFPSLISFNILLHVVQRSDHSDLVWKVYEHMVIKRIYPNQLTMEIMINAMCKAGILKEVVDILDRIHGKRCPPTVIVSTALTLKIIEDNRMEDGITLLKRMLQKNLILDDVACSMIVYAYCKMGDLHLVYYSRDNMLKRGHCMNSFVYTSLIGLFCREGNIEGASYLLDEMLLAGLSPYEETYNFLIEWCSKLGRLEQSVALFNEMLEKGFLPSCKVVTEFIGNLCKVGNVESANDVLTVLLDKGFKPNELVYCHLIDGFGRIENFQDVLKLYHELEWRGSPPSIAVYTSVIRSLCLCERLKEAEKILTIMLQKSFIPSREIYQLLSRASQKM